MPYKMHTDGNKHWYTWHEPKRRVAQPSISVSLTQHAGRPEREGDCSIRAIATYLDVPYAEARELAVSEYNYGNGHKGMLSTDFHRFARDFGLKYIERRIRINSKSAIDKLPRKCILLFRTHVAAYENGVVHDIFDTRFTRGTVQTVGYFVKA